MNRNEIEKKKHWFHLQPHNTVLYAFFSPANTFQAGRKRKSQNEQTYTRKKKINNCIFNLTTNSSRIPICLIISYSKLKKWVRVSTTLSSSSINCFLMFVRSNAARTYAKQKKNKNNIIQQLKVHNSWPILKNLLVRAIITTQSGKKYE